MHTPAYTSGGGYMPSPNYSQRQFAGDLNTSPIFGQFASALDAVSALPPRLRNVVCNLHGTYGAPLDIALGNVLGVLSFVCQGVSNVLDSKGDPMPLSTIVHVVGVPFGGKSATFVRLMRPVHAAMADWPHQWDFEDSTPQGIKRVSPVLGLCGCEEGDAFFETTFGKDFALQISLRDGFVPVVTRAKDLGGDRKKKTRTRFTIVVLIQPDRYDEWLGKHRKKGLGSGFLQRVWMVRSHEESNRSAIGWYPQAEGGLDDWDETVSVLLDRAKANGERHLASLPALDVAVDAAYVLNRAQQQIDFMVAQGVFREASAMAMRYHERVSVLAGLFQLYEGTGRVITRELMFAATVVANYLTGQWLGTVLPPEAEPQDELDARELMPRVVTEMRARNMFGIRESEIVTLAKNIKWMPSRTKCALMALYAAGQLRLVPRTINGRRVDFVELPVSSPYMPPLL
ncbi:hypothetical protein CUJ91_00195 [Paraburkholderia graminis]|uniref:DUF3987 domain-containing protein n=1 Tax=Paraburkholderia graminis TaxID=60548 RepID=UPI000DEFBBF6|nr:DUF3987 domain-containing protein [Paraburkholderia graminis]AXF06495.1 hypothetical protein CUJ91_00195 [Paraburkholderia graminis]